jgi:hypothetical protein
MKAFPTDPDATGPIRDGREVVPRDVLAAVDRALDMPAGERLSHIAGCAELDAAGRLAAERLLRQCEQCEELDRVAVSTQDGSLRDALDRAPFVLDLAALIAEAEADGSASHRLSAEMEIGPYRIVRFIAATR